MHIVLATGIYPPDFGGPATYVRALAEELTRRGDEVTVVTYGKMDSEQWTMDNDGWLVVRISKTGGPLVRWWRYARALRAQGVGAEVVYAFSSVSVGVPVVLSRLRCPKRFLRLGGDFGWERYTDHGGRLGLRAWYERGSFVFRFWFLVSRLLLRSFDHVVFSTRFQEELYEQHYRRLPAHSVIENAVPSGEPVAHVRHDPFRLLFLGRFVSFKNIPALLLAMRELPDCTLTLAGDGPLREQLEEMIAEEHLEERVVCVGSKNGDEKARLFAEHDALVLPSRTEISPNTALEARAAGLPVLLTEETGLSVDLARGMLLRPLQTAAEIREAIRDAMQAYDALAAAASASLIDRGWETIAEEHKTLWEGYGL